MCASLPNKMEAATLAAVAAYAAPLASRLRLGDAAAAMRRELAWAASSLDARLSGVPPHVVALLTLTFATACFAAFDVLGRALARARRRPGGPSAVLFASLRALPFVDALVQRQSDALLRKLAASRRAKAEAAARAAEDAGAAQPPPALLALPAVGAPAADVLDMAWHLADGDPGWTPGLGRFSGCVCVAPPLSLARPRLRLLQPLLTPPHPSRSEPTLRPGTCRTWNTLRC